jgi:hypothetical protein
MDAYEDISGTVEETTIPISGDPLVRLRACGDKPEHVVMHLYETETSYLADLDTLELFRERLAALGIPLATLKRIFAGVDELRIVHASFLRELTRICQEWNQDSVWAVGQLFVDFRGQWASYKTFIDNYQTSQREMRNLEKTNPLYRQFMADSLQSSETKRRDLGEFMIFPVQRVTRYSLILKDLLKYTTENHRHRSALISANREMDALAAFVNDIKAAEEARTQMFDAYETTSGCPATLISAKRRLVASVDVLDAKSKSLHVFLFNDLIMITKPLQKNYNWAAIVGFGNRPTVTEGDEFLYKFVRWIDLRDLKVIEADKGMVKLKYKKGDGTLTTFEDGKETVETLTFTFPGADAEKDRVKFVMVFESEKKRVSKENTS